MSSVGQVVYASSTAAHLGVLVAHGVQSDDRDLGVHFLAVHDLLECHPVHGEHSVLDAFLQEHLLLIRVARVLRGVQEEELLGASDRDLQQNGHFLDSGRYVNIFHGKPKSSLN